MVEQSQRFEEGCRLTQAKLSDVINAYVEASNSRYEERLTLFTRDVVVHDEGHERRGITAIKIWFAFTDGKGITVEEAADGLNRITFKRLERSKV